jgi:hypothetical protein
MSLVNFHTDVAQLVESQSPKLQVVGSIPSVRAILIAMREYLDGRFDSVSLSEVILRALSSLSHQRSTIGCVATHCKCVPSG